MKQLRNLCAGLFLILALSVPALAGDMHAPRAAGETQFPGVAESPGFAGIMDTPSIYLVISLLF